MNHVDLRFDEDFAILTLQRPKHLNALNFELIEELDACFTQVDASGARALLITGAGDKAFCAGADISELAGRSVVDERNGARRGQQVFARLDSLRSPSIAAVNGYALGGGLELALACTFRVASRQARFALPEIKLGLIPGYGGTQRLPRLIGEGRALELIMTGRACAADEALSIGLVHRVVDDALEGAKALAKEFTVYSLVAQGLAREAVQSAASTTLQAGLRREADLSTIAYRTGDAAEGLRAFMEKRKPTVEDR